MGCLSRRRSAPEVVENDGDMSETDSSPQKEGLSSQDSTSSEDESEPNLANETEMMLEVILKLREDPVFARSMYADCPRLQHLLNRHPDLRPIFEDPKLITLNFEKVYTDSGGILPEDLEKMKPNWFMRTKAKVLRKVVCITQSRWFKVFKCLLLIKKCLGFVSPMKLIGLGKGCLQSMCCSCLEDPENLLEEGEGGDGDGPSSETKAALNEAADYMEDPDVQEEMNRMLENPETMEDAIEQNENLRALRDSNPVCNELMSDPDTMKIFTDPDNLRAMGDAPEMIEADFGDAGFEPPETEVDFGGETDFPEAEMEGDFDSMEEPPQIEQHQVVENRLPDIEEVDESEFDDLEANEPEVEPQEETGEGGDQMVEEEEEGIAGPEVDDFEDVEYDDSQQSNSSSRARGKGNQARKQRGNQKRSGGRFGGVTESAMGYLGGAVFGEMLGDFSLGGGDEFDGLDEEPPDVEEVDTDGLSEPSGPDVEMEEHEIAEDAALAAMIGASMMGDEAEAFDDLADKAKDQVDNMEDIAEVGEDDKDKDGKRGAAGAACAGVVVAGGGQRSADDDEEEEDEGPKGFRGFMKNAASALKDAAKESLMAAVIGDEATEFLVDDLERDEEEEEDEEKEKKDDDKKEKKGKTKDTTSLDAIPETRTEAPTSGEDNFANALDS